MEKISTVMNPWPGLASYSGEDGRTLYGRSREINEVYSLIRNNLFVTLYGRSGIGKTSLIKAGVSPYLKRSGYIPVYVRLAQEIRNEGETTFAGCLVRSIREAAAKSHITLKESPTALDYLSPDALWQWFVSASLTTEDGNRIVPVIFLDQFEEVFSVDNKESILLLRQLCALVDGKRRLPEGCDGMLSRVRIVVSMRDDSLYRIEDVIDAYNLFPLRQKRYTLKPLGEKAAAEVIATPVEGLVSEEVMSQIIEKVGGMGSGGGSDPAVLSLMMSELFKKSDGSPITSELVAGMDNEIVDSFYREGTRNIPDKAMAFLETHLVTSDGRRSVVAAADMCKNVSQAHLESLLEAHVISRLERGKFTDYELSHDVLCKRVTHNKLERERWNARKRRQYIISGFIVTTLVLLGIIAAGIWSYNEIEKQKDRAETAKIHAEQANSKLQAAKDTLKQAYDSLALSQKNLAQSNADLNKSNKNLEIERNNVLEANGKILRNRSAEYANLAYNFIEQGKLTEAEDLLNEIIPTDKNPYVYTSEMEKALRRYFNYRDMAGIKLVENKEFNGAYDDADIFSYLSKYGYCSPPREWDFFDNDEVGIAVIDSPNDTLLKIHKDFDYAFLRDDGHIFIGVLNDTIFIWNIDEKRCISSEYIEDGVIDLKFLEDNRFFVFGYGYFTIYNFMNGLLQKESQIEIIGGRLRKGSRLIGDFPFVYDADKKQIIYQTDDSCLIVHNVSTNQIVNKRKIEGVIEHLAIGRLYDTDFYIAYNYKNEITEYSSDDIKRLQVLHYPSLTYLYEHNLNGCYVWKLGFLPNGYLYVDYHTRKGGVSNLYVFDMSIPFRYNDDMLFNMDSTFVIDRKRAKNIYGEVLCISRDNKIIYRCGNKMDDNFDSFKLCVYDTQTGETDILSTSDDIYSISVQDSYNGQYVVFSNRDKGVYLYDKIHCLKIPIDPEAKFANVSISSDGNFVCYKQFDQIFIKSLKSAQTQKYSPNVEFVSRMALNHNGTHLLFTDGNYTLYEYNIDTKESRQVSSALGYTKCFGFSEYDKYIYQIYDKDDGVNSKAHIRVWDFQTFDLIMDNELEYNASMLIFNEQNDFIYSHSPYRSDKIPFVPLSNLFERYNNSMMK